MHSLDVLICRNGYAAGREAAHKDVEDDSGVPVVPDPASTNNERDLLDLAGFAVGYAQGWREP